MRRSSFVLTIGSSGVRASSLGFTTLAVFRLSPKSATRLMARDIKLFS